MLCVHLFETQRCMVPAAARVCILSKGIAAASQVHETKTCGRSGRRAQLAPHCVHSLACPERRPARIPMRSWLLSYWLEHGIKGWWEIEPLPPQIMVHMVYIPGPIHPPFKKASR